ncbi:MAG TPA: two-component regulator propeller domain-containing protein, partial [Bacteroidota bacterium]|nr:two-component regulator propeller domain-containing protein [Bacteroidota bacterium]
MDVLRAGCVCVIMMYLEAATCCAGVGEWKTYTCQRNLKDIVVSNDVVWAATSGGLFSFRRSDGTFHQFTTSEGLKTIDLTAVTVDGSGNIWVGASNGFVHRYNPSTGTWDYVSDISLRSDPQKSINKLNVVGDTLFILSDIGVSIFSISRMEFISTFSRFGAGANPLVGSTTSMNIASGTLWIGTRNGIAATPLSNTNPAAPESWQIYTTTADTFVHPLNTNALLSQHDTLYAGTQNGLAIFDGTGWKLIPSSSGMNILGLQPGIQFFSGIIFITPNQLWNYTQGQMNSISVPSVLYSCIGSETVLGTQSSGFVLKQNSGWTVVTPPGPSSNSFIGIAVDNRGVVWSGTGTANGTGFMSFDGHTWRLYDSLNDTRLGTNQYYIVSIGRGNAKWISSWGKNGGVVLLDDTGKVVKVFNSTNGIPLSIVSSPTFVVVGGVATDQNGVAWITNRTASDSIAVVLFHPDSSLSYNVRLSMLNPVRIFTNVVIDQNGTKWFSNYSRFEPQAPIALYYYNEVYTLPGTTNGWGSMTTGNSLTSNYIYSLAVDQDGQVWVGTDQGINIIFDPSNPFGSIASYYPLQDQVIQGILVDPVNNKWVATKQGVFELSPDGTSILASYTAENTDGKLLDDDIASLAMNVKTGTIYFGTEKGLSSFTTAATTPVQNYDKLSFAPNPFYLPSTQPLKIDGLTAGSSIKILSIDGSLVRDLQTPGGRVGFWDGRNNRGDLVATAVYLVV